MKNNDLYLFLVKYKLLLIGLLLLFLTVLLLQVNYNKNNMHDYHVDEYYTIATIHPNLTPDNTVHRALNGPRMFTYLFYPGAMVGMINHMGGNIYEDGWKYPGHNYFVNNYRTTTSRLKDNMEDPNFRYFHYYLKLQAIVFMFLLFLQGLHVIDEFQCPFLPWLSTANLCAMLSIALGSLMSLSNANSGPKSCVHWAAMSSALAC